MTERRGLADVQDIAIRPKHAIDARRIGHREPNIPRHRPYAAPALPRVAFGSEPFLKCAPGRNSLVVEQAHQLSPDERCGLHVVGAAPQRAYGAAEIPSESTHPTAGQFGEEAAGNVVRAHDVEGRSAARQRAEEWPLESSEVNARWSRLPSEPSSCV